MNRVLTRPGVVLLAAALFVRCAWVVIEWVQTGAALSYPDEELHWQLARNLVSQGALVSADGRFAARMPGYPLFLAAFAWMGESGLLLARLAQAALGAWTVWIVYHLTRRTWGPPAGIAAALLVCCDPFLVFFSNLLLTETLFVLLAIALLHVASPGAALRRDVPGATRTPWGVGMLGAAAIMVRPSAAGWVVLLWVALWWIGRDTRRAWSRLALWTITLAAFLLPWGLRNWLVIGAPAWLSSNGGVTLYDAQGPQADGSSDQSFLVAMPELAELDEAAQDRALRRLAVEQMRANPGRVFGLAGRKFLRTWSLTPNVTEYSSGLVAIASAGYTAVVLIFAFVGLWRSWAAKPDDRKVRSGRRLQLLIWMPIVYFTLVHCVFIGSVRYRVPLMPLLAISAGAAFARQEATTSGDEHPGRD